MKKSCFIIVVICIVCHSLRAQDLDAPIYTRDKMIPAYYAVPNGTDFIKKGGNSNTHICRLLNLNQETSLVLCDTLTDITGGIHETYRELYKGIDVEGAKCVVHYNKMGIAKMISGNLRTIENLVVIPRITAWQSKSIAIETIKKDKSFTAFFNRNENSQSDDGLIDCNEGTLVVFMSDDIPHLAYRHHIQSIIPSLNKRIYIDANNGDYLGGYSTIHNISTNANTVYSGIRPIEIQFLNLRYVLRDNTRGSGIMTLRQGGNDYESFNYTWSDLSDYDCAAIDAHWGVEKTFDFYYSKFGRNSYDNYGSSIVSYVNFKKYIDGIFTDWPNASWSESTHKISFGRHKNGNPIVSLDVAAHELTHGVTQFTSGLIYERESGAIDEGMSDVFAVCIENEYKTNSEIWKIGEEVTVNGYRNLSNPSCKYYHGHRWEDTNQTPTDENDYCGVHTNSGVFSYWFYLISVGGPGYNESGLYYPVQGIGLDNAIQICYLMNASFLTSNATYNDAKISSYLAAQALGFGDDIIDQLRKAWIDVGVESPNLTISGYPIICDSNVYSVQNLPVGASVSWHFDNDHTALNSLIHSNYPALNQCTITTGNGDVFSANLQATIIANWTNVTTLSKAIYTPLCFYGTYSQTPEFHNKHNYPTIPETSFYDEYQFIVNPDCDIVIKSEKFRNMSISSNVSNIGLYKVDDETITFNIPYIPTATHFHIYATSANGCGNFSFLVSPIYIPLNILNDIAISFENQNLCITLPLLDDEMVMNEAFQKSTIPQKNRWYITITNVITGQTVYIGNPIETNLIINTANWNGGIYTINFTIDNVTVSKKVNIRKQ